MKLELYQKSEFVFAERIRKNTYMILELYEKSELCTNVRVGGQHAFIAEIAGRLACWVKPQQMSGLQ